MKDALDDLISDGSIKEQLAIRIVETFDRCFADAMAYLTTARMSLRGGLKDYRHVDDVYTLWCRDVTFKLDNQTQMFVERVKIVACLNKRNG